MYFLMAVLGIYGINGTLNIVNPQKGSMNSILSLPLIFGMFYLYRHTYSNRSKRELILSGVFAFPLSFVLIYGNALSVASENLVTIWNIMATVTLTPLIQCVLLKIQDFDICQLEQKVNYRISDKLFSSKKLSFIIFGTIMAVWIIGLLSMMPGYWGYDSAWQFNSFRDHSISTHHPIIHTYLLCGLVEMGEKHLGSYESGMLIYSILQMIILDYALTKVIKFCFQYSKIIAMIIWGCCALLPYNAILSFSGTKDVIFAALFVLWTLQIIHGNTDGVTWKLGYMFKLVVLAFFMCTFRNNGIYVFIATVPFWFALNKSNWKKLALVTICTLGIWSIYTGPVYKMLRVGKGSVHEMLSIPCQQLSAVYVYGGDLCGYADRVKEYIQGDGVENYSPRLADPVKGRFNDALFQKDKVGFFKLWFKIGAKNPRIYLNAFANTNIGFWYPDMVYPDPKAWHPYIEYILEPDDERMNPEICMQITQSTFLPKLTEINHRFSRYADFQRLPVISMLCSAGFYFWVLMVELYLILIRRNYRMIIGLIPAIMYWGTCLLGPVVLVRYAYPYMLAALVMLGPVLSQKGDK